MIANMLNSQYLCCTVTFCDQILFNHLFRGRDAYVNCKIVATPGKYNYKHIAFGLQKDSPFLPLLNHVLNDMKEKGSFKKIQVKYEPSPQMCPDYSGKSLGVGSVFVSFGLLFVGVGITGILFGLEKLTHSFGIKWSIFNSYGVVDHQDEFDESDTIALLASKSTEIVLLKKQILVLKKTYEST